MEYIYIGDIVNTHGIKGELRIISDFKYKEQIFKKNFNIYIGKEKINQVINSYRRHKIYDMITLVDLNNINDVLIYKGEKVYINRNDLDDNIILNEDLIGIDVYVENKYIGKITDVFKNINQEILVIKKDSIKNLVPNLDNFIEKIDLKNKKIFVKNIEGLIHEN